MNFQNPTRLQIGMTGEFIGKQYRIIGRVVMGVNVDGEDYYWSEFNLKSTDGSFATLVYDESESEAAWRMFTEFKLDYPMTSADAALKKVGDIVNLTGENVRVTWVGSSEVKRVEGIAPKGLRPGAEDHYFNAELGDSMIVVSWTGRQVEYYQGVILSSEAVSEAFAVKGPLTVRRSTTMGFDRSARLDDRDSTDYSGVAKFFIQGAVIVIFLLVAFGNQFSCRMPTRVTPVEKHLAAPVVPLAIGLEGRWQDIKYRIAAHVVMEIARTDVVFERHEYVLVDDFGLPSLLVCGDTPEMKEWTLYKQLSPLLPLTPQQAAAKTTGEKINVDGVNATITDLFQSTVRKLDAWEPTAARVGDVSFAHSGRSENVTLLVRWNDAGIRFYRGAKVLPKDFSAAFSPAQ